MKNYTIDELEELLWASWEKEKLERISPPGEKSGSPAGDTAEPPDHNQKKEF